MTPLSTPLSFCKERRMNSLNKIPLAQRSWQAILGMDVWERYKDFTREVLESRRIHIKVIEGSLKESI
jgi:hypothetical protein